MVVGILGVAALLFANYVKGARQMYHAGVAQASLGSEEKPCWEVDDETLANMDDALFEAFQTDPCTYYTKASIAAYAFRSLESCPAREVFVKCSDTVGAALLVHLPTCKLSDSQDFCRAWAAQVTLGVMEALSRSMEMSYMMFCKLDGHSLLERTYQHAYEAWCLGASSLEEVDFTRDPFNYSIVNTHTELLGLPGFSQRRLQVRLD